MFTYYEFVLLIREDYDDDFVLYLIVIRINVSHILTLQFLCHHFDIWKAIAI